MEIVLLIIIVLGYGVYKLFTMPMNFGLAPQLHRQMFDDMHAMFDQPPGAPNTRPMRDVTPPEEVVRPCTSRADLDRLHPELAAQLRASEVRRDLVKQQLEDVRSGRRR